MVSKAWGFSGKHEIDSTGDVNARAAAAGFLNLAIEIDGIGLRPGDVGYGMDLARGVPA